MITQRMHLALPFLLALALYHLAQAARFGSSRNLICIDGQTDLTTRNHFLALAEQLREPSKMKCDYHIWSAVQDFDAILKEPPENLCTLDVARRVRKFFLDYLYTLSGNQGFSETQKPEEERFKIKRLPRRFKEFVIAFGMQLSDTCQEKLVESFYKDYRVATSSKDFDHLNIVIGYGRPLTRLLDGLDEPEKIVLPPDLVGQVSKSGENSPGKMYIQTEHANTIKSIQRVCQERFQPIYEQLILPVATLASVGLNQEDSRLQQEYVEDGYLHSEMKQWSRILFVCESLKMVGVFDLDFGYIDAAKLRSKPQRRFKIITKEEAEALRLRSDLHNNSKRASDLVDDIQGNKFRMVVPTEMKNLVLDRADKKLMKSIRKMKVNRLAVDRVKKKISRRALAILKRRMSEGELGLTFTSTVKGAWVKQVPKKLDKDDEIMLAEIQRAADKASEEKLVIKPLEVVTDVVQIFLSVATISFWMAVNVPAWILVSLQYCKRRLQSSHERG